MLQPRAVRAAGRRRTCGVVLLVRPSSSRGVRARPAGRAGRDRARGSSCSPPSVYLVFLALWGLELPPHAAGTEARLRSGAGHARSGAHARRRGRPGRQRDVCAALTPRCRSRPSLQPPFAAAQRLLGADRTARPGRAQALAARPLLPLGGDRRHDRSVLPRGDPQSRRAADRAAVRRSRTSGRTWPATPTNRRRTSWPGSRAPAATRSRSYSGWLALYAH